MKKQRASAEQLRELLHYDPATGVLTWKPRDISLFKSKRDWLIWNTRFAGKQAMTATNEHGYFVGRVFRVLYKAHRVVWAIVHGNHPKEIDHINGVRSDNRLANLRDVDRSNNMRNAARRKDNSTGVTGVSVSKATGKYRAQINTGETYISLGYFDTVAKAAAARKEAEAALLFHENHGRAST